MRKKKEKGAVGDYYDEDNSEYYGRYEEKKVYADY